MNVEHLVFWGYVAGAVVFILLAVLFAVAFTRAGLEPDLRISLDCLAQNHGGCQSCDGCMCHPGVRA